MGVRLIAVRDADTLISVSRELGQRGHGYLCWSPRRVLLASQSVARLAHIIQRLVHAPGSDFDSVLDSVHPQGLYNSANGTIRKGYHKTWRIERVELRHLPERFAELHSEGFSRVGIVAVAECNWTIRTGATVEKH